MAESIIREEEKEEEEEEGEEENREKQGEAEVLAMEKGMSRKEKRKALKKMKRKQVRKEIATKEREEEEARLNDPEEQMTIKLMKQEEAERSERERKEFEEREKAWLEAMEIKKKKLIEDEEKQRKALDEDSRSQEVENANEGNESDHWEYVEDGPAEIIWQGNEIIFKKKKIRVPKKESAESDKKVDADRPISNPLPPESEAFAKCRNSLASAQDLIDSVAQEVPNFGTEQDKAHCPFHLKTGACRFGQRCSRVHFYPDKSCTLLIKNMYNGPGLAWEQDEGLEYTDEEVERCYEEFYEDVHTEFLKFGEIVNFKVCRNGSFHLRGNVYVHFKSLDSAVLAHHHINGRYFAGKQIKCEFVNITRWKVAICGEYMKSKFKTCSHGTACNFIHCFRNPGGDYEWADSDKPPPRYWIRKMAALFGNSDKSACEKRRVEENLDQPNRFSRIKTANADRYHRSRRSGSREMDYLLRGSSGRRKENEDNVQRRVAQLRCTSDDREEINYFHENVRKESMHLKFSHYRKRKNRDTDTGESYDDGRQMNGDGYHEYTPKSSRKMSRDKKNTHESDSDGDWSVREGENERHHGRARKSSKYRSRMEYLDDCGDHERKNHEVYGDRRNKGIDSETDHDIKNGSRHPRKAGYPGDHRDGKKKSHDTDKEWSDKDSDGYRHSRRGKSSGLHRKIDKSSDDRGTERNRASIIDFSDEWLNKDKGRHSSHDREYSNEASDFSDDGGPVTRLKDRRDYSSRDISKSDTSDKKSKSGRSCDSSCSSQYEERCISYDLRYNSDLEIEKLDRWEPEQDSYERRHKSGRKASNSGSSGRCNGRDKSCEYDSGLYYYNKAEDYPPQSEETKLKHQKHKRKSGRGSRSSSRSSHRRHRNSSDESDSD